MSNRIEKFLANEEYPSVEWADFGATSVRGAYLVGENRILISDHLKGNEIALQFVLLEEFGHWLDDVSASDSKGDEGDIFARTLTGNELVTSLDDSRDRFSQVEINGVLYDAEFAIPTLDIDSSSTEIASNGTDITLVFSEDLATLNAANSSVADQFDVYINGSGTPVTPGSISLSGATLTLSLGSADKIESTDVVTISYTQDTVNTAYRIESNSTAGLLANFTNVPVNNSSSQDLTKPLPLSDSASSVASNGDTLSIKFDENLSSFTTDDSNVIKISYSIHGSS